MRQTDESVFKEDVGLKVGETLTTYWIGCSHLDSIYCNRTKLKRLLDEAKSEGAHIFFAGDNNDLMQGHYDPRRNYNAIKNRDKRNAYLNDIVEDTIDFLSPYKDNIKLMIMGNHETSAKKNLDFNITSDVAKRLGVNHAGVECFLKYDFTLRSLTTGENTQGKKVGKRILLKHDGGSLGKRSKGALACDMLAAQYRADIFIWAHAHQALTHSSKVQEVTNKGKRYYKDVQFLQCPSFKEEWKDRTKTNWWTCTNKGARAVGGHKLVFRALSSKDLRMEATFISP